MLDEEALFAQMAITAGLFQEDSAETPRHPLSPLPSPHPQDGRRADGRTAVNRGTRPTARRIGSKVDIDVHAYCYICMVQAVKREPQ
jgi:hypothetical protein